jgi:hypothetical protein
MSSLLSHSTPDDGEGHRDPEGQAEAVLDQTATY